MTINFITSNPALDAFDKGQKEDREARLSDARAALLAGQAEFQRQAMPSQLRSIDAGATTAETEAGVGQKTAPNRIEMSGVNLGKAKTEAGSEEVEADVRRQTAPVRVQQASTGLRQANATALNTEMTGFYKSLDLLDKGDTAGAQEVARQTGHQIPAAVLNDAELRGAVSQAAKRAQELYPNRPKDQQAFITGRVGDIQRKRAAGQPISDPTEAYTPPSNAPEPQTTSGGTFQRFNTMGPDEQGNVVPGVQVYNSKDEGSGQFQPHAPIQRATGAGAGGNPTALTKNAQFYVANGIAPDIATAVGMLRASVNDPATFNRLVQAEKKVMRADPKLMNVSDADIEMQAQQNVKSRRQASGPPPAPGSLGSVSRVSAPLAPAPPAATPEMMTPGDGGRPLNLQIPPYPPGVPPGSSYSPSRQMWRDASGQVYDASGQPAQQ